MDKTTSAEHGSEHGQPSMDKPPAPMKPTQIKIIFVLLPKKVDWGESPYYGWGIARSDTQPEPQRMMKSKEQKQAEAKILRDRWNETKARATAGDISAAEAAIATHGLNISVNGFLVAAAAMAAAGLDGLPYLDAKTFQGWKGSGFMVRKGEKSFGSGITWVSCGEKSDKATGETRSAFMFPRSYALFHRSQVSAMEETATLCAS